jgi:hypothetical protein
VLEPTGLTRLDRRTGERTLVTEKRRRLSLTDDAHTLSSGTPVERLYADHSNRMKALANQARLEILNTPRLKQSKSAKKVYERKESLFLLSLIKFKGTAPLKDKPRS